MKYYVVEVSQGDSKIAGKAVYEYDDVNSATAIFHSKLGTAMKSELYTDELIVVIDSDGCVVRQEHYETESDSTDDSNDIV